MDIFRLFYVNMKDSFWDQTTREMNYSGREKTRIGRPTQHRFVFKPSEDAFTGLQSELPPREELPQPIQDFLRDIDGLPREQQLQKVHDFVNDNMRYPSEYDAFIGDKEMSSYQDVINKWTYGDCDKRVLLSAALLQYAGFHSDDLTMLAGKARYTGTGENQPDLGGGGHGTLVVRLNGQHYMMDMNLADVVPIDRRNDGHFHAAGIYRNAPEAYRVQVDIDPALVFPTTPGEVSFSDPDKLRVLRQEARDMFEPPVETGANVQPSVTPASPSIKL